MPTFCPCGGEIAARVVSDRRGTDTIYECNRCGSRSLLAATPTATDPTIFPTFTTDAESDCHASASVLPPGGDRSGVGR